MKFQNSWVKMILECYAQLFLKMDLVYLLDLLLCTLKRLKITLIIIIIY